MFEASLKIEVLAHREPSFQSNVFEMERIQEMATIRQIQANQRNGKLSNGPVSQDGKAVSARNSLKHGLLSSDVVLADEDPEVFEQLRDRMLSDLKPVGELELVQAERIVQLSWRLRRACSIESRILECQMLMTKIERAGEAEYLADPPYDSREELRPSDSPGLRPWRKARAARKRLLMEKQSIVPSTGEAFLRDCGNENALAKLSRYEASLERSFYKALHELQRLQAARHGKDVPLPMAMDVEISHTGPCVIESTVEEDNAMGPRLQVALHGANVHSPPARDVEASDASPSVAEGTAEETES